MQPEILHLPSWAKTALGTPVELYRKGHMAQRPLLLIGGVHGDEPEGVRLAEDLLRWMQTEAKSPLKDWILIPCLNPDGFRRNERTNGRGVDLNRNFPSKDWVAEREKGDRYFPGTGPASEPETQALVRLIADEKPHLILHFHSWEPCVVYTGEPGKLSADLLGKNTGYEVREDIGYPTPGSLGQYGWLECQTPVICLEAQAGMPLDKLWPHWGANLRALLGAGSP